LQNRNIPQEILLLLLLLLISKLVSSSPLLFSSSPFPLGFLSFPAWLKSEKKRRR